MITVLQRALRRLQERARREKQIEYSIPSLWIDPLGTGSTTDIKYPASFYSDCASQILKFPRPIAKTRSRSWLRSARIYCMLLRHATAFDHDGNDKLQMSDYGWRDTGTFLKCIALIPYLKSLGVNTLYLLPIQQRSSVNRKGNLGSPYSIRNQFELDDELGEPCLSLSTSEQFKALVEACHLAGIRVIVEFVLRTASLDSEWALDHSEWFYWIKNKTDGEFRPPHFSPTELRKIATKVRQQDLTNLPEPNDDYKSLFSDTPVEVWKEKEGRIIGRTTNGELCTLPGAFADYPPDDKQPLWSDVSYLKLFDHPSFNYMAYNTLRMYDAQLSKRSNRIQSLWDTIESILPHYISEYGIDGAVIDMSHAMPESLRRGIIKSARAADPSFVLIEENFTISSESKKMGFDAVVGDMWGSCNSIRSAKEFARRKNSHITPIQFFATPDTHNTPRVASRLDSKQTAELYTLTNAIPNGIPVIVAGSEFAEQVPLNTGLGFSKAEMKKYPSEKLPLFSACTLGWERANLRLLRSMQEMKRG